MDIATSHDDGNKKPMFILDGQQPVQYKITRERLKNRKKTIYIPPPFLPSTHLIPFRDI